MNKVYFLMNEKDTFTFLFDKFQKVIDRGIAQI